MSPRSEEFMDRARRRLTAARHAIDAGDAEAAVSSAIYAMLYAARAALSERDIHAKTHRGTWGEFTRAFVHDGPVEPRIGGLGSKAQRVREQADYEGEEFSTEDAESTLADADRFIEAVSAVLD